MIGNLVAYAVAAGALLFIGLQWHERGQRIEDLLTASGTIVAKYDQCEADSKAADEALAEIRAAGEVDRDKRAEAERAAAQTAADAERRVRAALIARVPSECPAAMRWLGDSGRVLAGRWEAGQ